MFGSNLLDIAIGLILTYVMLSLLVTAVNELIAGLLRSRARDLERGIRNLLDAKSSVPERWWGKIVRRFRGTEPPVAGPWSDAFFDHQLINGLSKDHQRPSYIPSQTFVMVLLNLVQRSKITKENCTTPGAPMSGALSFDEIRDTIKSINNDAIKEALLPLVEEARSGAKAGISAVKQFSDQVEIWFDHAMDRVSGWYKRRTQWMLLMLALLATAIVNVDTIAICRQLARDETLRTALVESAKTVAARQVAAGPQSAASFDENFKDVQMAIQNLHGLGIPLGWKTDGQFGAGRENNGSGAANTDVWTYEAVVSKIVGLLLTALAASLGAPFWFDMLNKLVMIRGSGKAPEERQKNPKKVLKPKSPQDTPTPGGR